MTEAAERLGVTRQTLSAVLNGRAGISADMDLRLAAALKPRPASWLRLQAQRDLWKQSKTPRPKIAPFKRAARVRASEKNGVPSLFSGDGCYKARPDPGVSLPLTLVADGCDWQALGC